MATGLNALEAQQFLDKHAERWSAADYVDSDTNWPGKIFAASSGSSGYTVLAGNIDSGRLTKYADAAANPDADTEFDEPHLVAAGAGAEWATIPSSAQLNADLQGGFGFFYRINPKAAAANSAMVGRNGQFSFLAARGFPGDSTLTTTEGTTENDSTAGGTAAGCRGFFFDPDNNEFFAVNATSGTATKVGVQATSGTLAAVANDLALIDNPNNVGIVEIIFFKAVPTIAELQDIVDGATYADLVAKAAELITPVLTGKTDSTGNLGFIVITNPGGDWPADVALKAGKIATVRLPGQDFDLDGSDVDADGGDNISGGRGVTYGSGLTAVSYGDDQFLIPINFALLGETWPEIKSTDSVTVVLEDNALESSGTPISLASVEATLENLSLSDKRDLRSGTRQNILQGDRQNLAPAFAAEPLERVVFLPHLLDSNNQFSIHDTTAALINRLDGEIVTTGGHPVSAADELAERGLLYGLARGWTTGAENLDAYHGFITRDNTDCPMSEVGDVGGIQPLQATTSERDMSGWDQCVEVTTAASNRTIGRYDRNQCVRAWRDRSQMRLRFAVGQLPSGSANITIDVVRSGGTPGSITFDVESGTGVQIVELLFNVIDDGTHNINVTHNSGDSSVRFFAAALIDPQATSGYLHTRHWTEGGSSWNNAIGDLDQVPAANWRDHFIIAAALCNGETDGVVDRMAFRCTWLSSLLGNDQDELDGRSYNGLGVASTLDDRGSIPAAFRFKGRTWMQMIHEAASLGGFNPAGVARMVLIPSPPSATSQVANRADMMSEFAKLSTEEGYSVLVLNPDEILTVENYEANAYYSGWNGLAETRNGPHGWPGDLGTVTLGSLTSADKLGFRFHWSVMLEELLALAKAGSTRPPRGSFAAGLAVGSLL